MDSRYNAEWMDYSGEHQEELWKAHAKFVDHAGPATTVLYYGKKTAWEINLESMKQMNQKTKTVRPIKLVTYEPVELSYVDAGPPRRPYTRLECRDPCRAVPAVTRSLWPTLRVLDLRAAQGLVSVRQTLRTSATTL